MLLSICIPTFNRLPYLKEAIDALLPQIEKTMPGQVEFLVSDNCSTDGTADYLAAIQSNRLRFWTNEVNIGGDRNFLKCISEARGDYVWLVGDDDLVAHDGVERVLAALLSESPDIVIADELDMGEKVYPDYRSCLIGERGRRRPLALTHTLISANIFKRTLFDAGFAESHLWTSYAHMFGFVGGLAGKVVLLSHVLLEQNVRAEFEKYPSFLCIKHAIYLWYLASRFKLPSYRWLAMKSVCNLPMEFGSRIKFHLKKLFSR